MERRLVVILAADMVAYSRLMEADEEGTLSRLSIYRRAIYGLIESRQGRVFGTVGDSVIAEFASPVQALRCAIEIQHDLEVRNRDLPENQRMRIRIGVNLGDVMVEGDDLQGDGVNVAARLEALAVPGGICISGPLFDQVEGKLDCGFDDLGAQKVKNIAKPVRAYRVRTKQAKGKGDSGDPEPLALPDKPSIAVLPFANLSADPEQEYFSDGITEDIITELSRFRSLFVIARNSSFTYKGQAINVTEVGKALGVQYVVEGSVRKAGNRIRVTAQLVNAATGKHLWAERYDRDLEDIFAVQDEVTQTIVSTVAGRLDDAGVDRARRKPTENMVAYDYLLRGEGYLRSDYRHDAAPALFEKAIEIDPQCARAFARLAVCNAMFSHGRRNNDQMLKARILADRALALDSCDPLILSVAASAYLLIGEHDLARRNMQAAIELNPNDTQVIYSAGLIFLYLGDHAEAQRWVQEVRRLDPHPWEAFHPFLFDVYYMNREYERAIKTMGEFRNPNVFQYGDLAAAYAQLGRMDEARAVVAQLNKATPEGYDFAAVAAALVGICKRKEDAEHWLEGYRKAGLLE